MVCHLNKRCLLWFSQTRPIQNKINQKSLSHFTQKGPCTIWQVYFYTLYIIKLIKLTPSSDGQIYLKEIRSIYSLQFFNKTCLLLRFCAVNSAIPWIYCFWFLYLLGWIDEEINYYFLNEIIVQMIVVAPHNCNILLSIIGRRWRSVSWVSWS